MLYLQGNLKECYPKNKFSLMSNNHCIIKPNCKGVKLKNLYPQKKFNIHVHVLGCDKDIPNHQISLGCVPAAETCSDVSLLFFF